MVRIYAPPTSLGPLAHNIREVTSHKGWFLGRKLEVYDSIPKGEGKKISLGELDAYVREKLKSRTFNERSFYDAMGDLGRLQSAVRSLHAKAQTEEAHEKVNALVKTIQLKSKELRRSSLGLPSTAEAAPALNAVIVFDYDVADRNGSMRYICLSALESGTPLIAPKSVLLGTRLEGGR